MRQLQISNNPYSQLKQTKKLFWICDSVKIFSVHLSYPVFHSISGMLVSHSIALVALCMQVNTRSSWLLSHCSMLLSLQALAGGEFLQDVVCSSLARAPGQTALCVLRTARRAWTADSVFIWTASIRASRDILKAALCAVWTCIISARAGYGLSIVGTRDLFCVGCSSCNVSGRFSVAMPIATTRGASWAACVATAAHGIC